MYRRKSEKNVFGNKVKMKRRTQASSGSRAAGVEIIIISQRTRALAKVVRANYCGCVERPYSNRPLVEYAKYVLVVCPVSCKPTANLVSYEYSTSDLEDEDQPGSPKERLTLPKPPEIKKRKLPAPALPPHLSLAVPTDDPSKHQAASTRRRTSMASGLRTSTSRSRCGARSDVSWSAPWSLLKGR